MNELLDGRGPEPPSLGDLLPFLSSLQLADSFFPSGLYTLSHGLESYAQAGWLDAATLESLIVDLLRFGVGPSDGIALACAHRAAATAEPALAVQADRRLTAVKLAREGREASLRTGRQLLALAAEVFGGDVLTDYAARVARGEAPGNHAVALGLTMATLGIPRVQAIAGELYAFAASCAGASLRLGIVDHRVAQTVLHRLRPEIVAVAGENVERGVEEIGGCAPLAEVMAMRHEQAEVRLFGT